VSVGGKVYLVGAGPGDPALVTLAALERIREADVIVYDRLVSSSLLTHARPDAELIFMGKVGGAPSHDQDAINKLLVDKAGEGKRVVRLKGGDPFVFGRGGEEAQAVLAAGFPFEVVPGVTSAVAVPAYAGIPVTHRGVATTFAVVTGHEDPAKAESAIRWDALAPAVDTLVLLMGIKTLPDVIQKLVRHGRPPETPVAVIRWGTTPDQRVVVGTLADIVRRIEEAGLTPPAITIVGDVVRLREQLAWFENRPLFGRRVLVTRTRSQASALARLLAEEGALPIELPTIEIERAADLQVVDAAITDLADGRYAWTAFTSANAVDVFFDLLRDRRLDARVFGRCKVIAIGPASAEALNRRGVLADVVPSEYIAEGVVEALRSRVVPGDRVLLPRAEGARVELVEGIASLGARVDEVTLYRAVVPEDQPSEPIALLRDGAIDIVTFTSSSTVRNMVSILDGDVKCLKKPLVACIGPITADTAREMGLEVDVEASEHTVPGLVSAIGVHVMEARNKQGETSSGSTIAP
jgi:uroporphyrinogen III methyltransferase/synthase